LMARVDALDTRTRTRRWAGGNENNQEESPMFKVSEKEFWVTRAINGIVSKTRTVPPENLK